MNKDKFKANYICVTVLNHKLTLKQKVSYYRKAIIQLLILQKLQVCRFLLLFYLERHVCKAKVNCRSNLWCCSPFSSLYCKEAFCVGWVSICRCMWYLHFQPICVFNQKAFQPLNRKGLKVLPIFPNNVIRFS